MLENESVAGAGKAIAVRPIADRLVRIALGAAVLTTCWFLFTLLTASHASAAEGIPKHGPAGSGVLAIGLDEITEPVTDPARPVTDPVKKALKPVAKPVAKPVRKAVRPATEPLTSPVRSVLTPIAPSVAPVAHEVTKPVADAVHPLTQKVAAPVAKITAPIEDTVEGLAPIVDDVVAPAAPVVDHVAPVLPGAPRPATERPTPDGPALSEVTAPAAQDPAAAPVRTAAEADRAVDSLTAVQAPGVESAGAALRSSPPTAGLSSTTDGRTAPTTPHDGAPWTVPAAPAPAPTGPTGPSSMAGGATPSPDPSAAYLIGAPHAISDPNALPIGHHMLLSTQAFYRPGVAPD